MSSSNRWNSRSRDLRIREGARVWICSIAALTAACAHSGLVLSTGPAAQGDRGEVICSISRGGSWNGRDCKRAQRQLQLSVMSYCAVSGLMYIEITRPDESRVQVEQQVELKMGEREQLLGPCFEMPRDEHTAIAVAVRTRCATTGGELTASATCVIP